MGGGGGAIRRVTNGCARPSRHSGSDCCDLPPDSILGDDVTVAIQYLNHAASGVSKERARLTRHCAMVRRKYRRIVRMTRCLSRSAQQCSSDTASLMPLRAEPVLPIAVAPVECMAIEATGPASASEDIPERVLPVGIVADIAVELSLRTCPHSGLRCRRMRRDHEISHRKRRHDGADDGTGVLVHRFALRQMVTLATLMPSADNRHWPDRPRHGKRASCTSTASSLTESRSFLSGTNWTRTLPATIAGKKPVRSTPPSSCPPGSRAISSRN